MRTLAILLIVAALLAGCSDSASKGDDSSSTSTTTSSTNTTTTPVVPETVTLATSAEGIYPGNARLQPAAIRIPANATVDMTFTNNDPNVAVSHNWVLEGVTGASTASVASRASTKLTFTAPAEAGEYDFYCSIGDHRARGMFGVLTVE